MNRAEIEAAARQPTEDAKLGRPWPPPRPEDAENILFVSNILRLTGEGSFEVAPGYVLRRADETERESIKLNLEFYFGISGAALAWEMPYPLQVGNWMPLPPEACRYFVVHYTPAAHDVMFRVREAFAIAAVELEILFDGSRSRPEFGYSFGGDVQHMYQHMLNKRQAAMIATDAFVEVSAKDVESIQALYRLLESHDHQVINVKRLIAQLQHLKALFRYSPLQFLGHFAILEALLAHKPEPTDQYQAITRQVKRKVTLLDNIWSPRLNYSAFGGLAADKVWTKMYAYRSALAHGDEADFKGEFKVLRDQLTALTLLRDTVKAVIREALRSPQLIRDLREC